MPETKATTPFRIPEIPQSLEVKQTKLLQEILEVLNEINMKLDKPKE